MVRGLRGRSWRSPEPAVVDGGGSAGAWLGFVKQNLGEIIDEFEDLPTDWPGDETVKAFVQRAGGLFIYAATVCRFVKGDDQWPPQDLLDLFIPG
jgi:hypothetical protein